MLIYCEKFGIKDSPVKIGLSSKQQCKNIKYNQAQVQISVNK